MSTVSDFPVMGATVDLKEYLQHQLSSDSDCRSEILADGFTKYNTTLSEHSIVPLGTCTASSLDRGDFSVLVNKLCEFSIVDLNSAEVVANYWSEIRKDFLNSMKIKEDLVDLVFVPSGTDSETLISSVILDTDKSAKLNNIVVAPLEVGSGTVLACEGRAFSTKTPDGSIWEIGQSLNPSVTKRTEVFEVDIRNSSGEISSMAKLEGDVRSIIQKSISEESSSCLHVVAGSKTGAHAPNIKFIEELESASMEKFHVIIDAAQGRFSRTGVSKSLELGRIVTITASKFFGAPPFCGAVLFPKKRYGPVRWKDEYDCLFDELCFPNQNSIPEKTRNGLLYRWLIGVSNMKEYYSTPPIHRLSALKWFEEDGIRIIQSSPSLDYVEPQHFSPDEKNRLLATNKTIHTFRIEKNNSFLDISELRKIHRDLVYSQPRGFHLGQPVALSRESGEAGLRIALGSKIIVELVKIIQKDNRGNEAARDYLTKLVSSACDRIEELVS